MFRFRLAIRLLLQQLQCQRIPLHYLPNMLALSLVLETRRHRFLYRLRNSVTTEPWQLIDLQNHYFLRVEEVNAVFGVLISYRLCKLVCP